MVSTMTPITDPNLISQLESNTQTPVTDPNLIAQLEGNSQPQNIGGYQNFPQGFIQGATTAGRYAQDVGTGIGNGLGGIAQGGEAIGNAMTRGINDLFGTNLPQNSTVYTNQFSGPSNPTFGDKLLQGMASFAPYAMGGELALPEEVLGSRLLGQGVIGQGVTGAAYGATQSQNPLSGGIKGAVANVAMGVPGMIASKAFDGLAGNLTSDELAQNVAAAQGTNTGLGAVLNSPTLQFGQKAAMAIPFGGGQGIQNKITNQITNQGQNLLNNLSNNIAPQDIGSSLQQALKNQLSSLQTIKNQNYAKVNQLADNLNLNVGNDNTQQAATNALTSINQDPRLKSTIGKGFIKDIQSAAANNPVNTSTDVISGTTTNPQVVNLKNANIYKSTLSDKANTAYQDGNLYQYGIYKSLRDGVDQDINNAISNSGSPELQSAYNTAQQFYGNEIAPWEDPNIAKFARGNADPDTLISAFVKPGLNNDRGNLISSLVNKLPPEQQSLPGFSYLSRANTPDSVTGQPTFDPIKFTQLYNNIGPNTKNALFGNGPVRQQLEQYNNLIGMNRNILTSNIAGTQHKALGAEAALGALGEHFIGLPHVVAAGLGLAGGANIANRLLTNPMIRNAVVNRIQNPVPYTPGIVNKYTGGYGVTPGLAGNQ